MSQVKNRIVILPDTHTPNHHYQSINPILQFIKFYKPDILIQLGDFCDWDSVSSYEASKENDIVTIEKEISSANLLLDEIDKACPKNCKKIMLGGNHEARYAAFVVKRGCELSFKRMKDFSRWEIEYDLYNRGWDSFGYGSHVQIGKVVFTHGFFTGPNAARRMADCFPGRNVIFGHTHQHLIYNCLDEHDFPIESESIGTLSRFDLSYLKGKPPINWVHMFEYIDMMENGRFSKHPVKIIDGKFIEYGRIF